MTLYSHNLNTPQPLPDKIVLSNGFTRTDPETFTDDEIADAGYVAAPDMPTYNNKTHKCLWVNTEWVIYELNDEEKADVKQKEWASIQNNIIHQQHAALTAYKDCRTDLDAEKQPMFLLDDINAWLVTLELENIYNSYNETLGQFTIPGFAWEVNPDWTPE